MNVYEKKNEYGMRNSMAAIDPIASEVSRQEDSKSIYPSTSYQKVLDYHVAEILLSTIVLAVIALLRLHR
jgi:hypothetical protein